MRRRIESDDLPDAVQYFKQAPIPTGEIHNHLADALQAEEYVPERLRALTSLPFTRIVTTNFENSLHDAWALVRKRAPVQAELGDPTLARAIYDERFKIARIHGRIDVPDSMVLGTSDYARLADNWTYTDFLINLLTRYSCLFVGFAFTDPAITEVLKEYERRVGPTFPHLHLALVPASAESLATRLRQLNIEVETYEDSESDHATLWRGIASAASAMSSSGKEPDTRHLDSAHESSRKLVASSYVALRMEPRAAPVRDTVLQGLIVAACAEETGPIAEDQLFDRIARSTALTADELRPLAQSALNTLVSRQLAIKHADRTVECTGFEDAGMAEDLRRLRAGVEDRLKVRHGLTMDNTERLATEQALEEITLSRGWDLGAHFAGATVDSALRTTVVAQAFETSHPAIAAERSEAFVEATYHMLTRPNSQEESILVSLGRLAFGVDVVLQYGRTALLHSETLPSHLYLDASFIMPAIVNGSPFRATYRDALIRLIEAARSSGSRLEILVPDEFLNEIVSHRELAVSRVGEFGLESREALRRYLLFRGAENTNIFIGAYSAWVGRVGGDPPAFSEWLEEHAPYSTMDELRSHLRNEGFGTVSLAGTAHREEQEDYFKIRNALEVAYTTRSLGKADILIRHEARQLARLRHDMSVGMRSLFVSADNQLKRAASGQAFGLIGNHIVSHVGLVMLTDFLVGLNTSDASLSRLMWGVRALESEVDGFLGLRAYFTDIALQELSEVKALALPEVLDRLVDEIGAAHESGAIETPISAGRGTDQAEVATMLDRFEEHFNEYMREAIEKWEAEESQPC
ncbi:MAG: SIR2 family protein [Chloroflexi bacterium]|nr:SIR2 family protein [Chloroflexota bacterium]